MTEEEYMALKPTRKPWKCIKCGIELFTVEVIKAHKERCTNNPNVKTPKSQYEIERSSQLKESLRLFKEKHGIKKRMWNK